MYSVLKSWIMSHSLPKVVDDHKVIFLMEAVAMLLSAMVLLAGFALKLYIETIFTLR